MFFSLRNISHFKALLLVAGFSAVALLGAFISQYGFNLHPCELCLYQRYPYGMIIVLCLIGLVFKRSKSVVVGILLGCFLLYLGEAGLAGYHAGVEWGIFEGLDSCRFNPEMLLDPTKIKEMLMNAPLVSCKDAPFRILGLSMAGWNCVICALEQRLLYLYSCEVIVSKPNLSSLPGDETSESLRAEMIRVNHAGEYGARRIYEGQLAFLKGTDSEALVQEMKEQELVHLAAFDDLIRKENIRPTALLPLWHVGGYMMGAVTALMGEKAAMACTVAVEEVIDAHYAEQEATLDDGELKRMVTQFREDEQEHHAIGLKEGAEDAPFYEMLHTGVSAITKAAIFLSKRL